MKTTQINLPEEIQRHMKQSKEEPHSYEWFQEAFGAVTRLAIDNAESVAEEFRKVFASRIDDEDELEEILEQMMKQAGLLNLG
jgi:hypothetical protein